MTIEKVALDAQGPGDRTPGRRSRLEHVPARREISSGLARAVMSECSLCTVGYLVEGTVPGGSCTWSFPGQTRKVVVTGDTEDGIKNPGSATGTICTTPSGTIADKKPFKIS